MLKSLEGKTLEASAAITGGAHQFITEEKREIIEDKRNLVRPRRRSINLGLREERGAPRVGAASTLLSEER